MIHILEWEGVILAGTVIATITLAALIWIAAFIYDLIKGW